MCKLIFTAAMALMAVTAAPAAAQAAKIDVPAGEYVLDKTHASIIWKVTHLGLSHYTARFTGFDMVLMLDPVTPAKSTIAVTIDPRSVKTDFPFPEKEDFDKVIAEKFLQAGDHPAITFQSSSLKATGAKTGKLTGNLSMMGVTKPVVLDVTLNGAMVHPFRKIPVVGFSATGKFNRSDFGSTVLQGPIGDEVTVIIEAEFFKK
jgi:polyisoprenoid-binding protein YceI